MAWDAGPIAPGLIVRSALFCAVPSEAMMVATVAADTAAVGKLKVCCAAPAATVTLTPGNAGLAEKRLTVVPEPAAGAVSVTITLTLLPPTIEVGERLMP